MKKTPKLLRLNKETLYNILGGELPYPTFPCYPVNQVPGPEAPADPSGRAICSGQLTCDSCQNSFCRTISC